MLLYILCNVTYLYTILYDEHVLVLLIVLVELEGKTVTLQLCELVARQAKRPSNEHKKELHSTVVAAFQCLSSWLGAYPAVLFDAEALRCVLSTIELGISGPKSKAAADQKQTVCFGSIPCELN